MSWKHWTPEAEESAADCSDSDTDLSGEQLQEASNDCIPESESIVVSSLPQDELFKHFQDLQKAHAALQEKFSESKKKLKKAKKETKRLQKGISALSSNLKFLNEDQKAALQKQNRKGCVWSAATVKKGLQLKFSCGSTGYDLLLEQGNPLPSRKTLCRRLQHLSFQPGVLTDIFDVMKTKVATLSDVEKDCFVPG